MRPVLNSTMNNRKLHALLACTLFLVAAGVYSRLSGQPLELWRVAFWSIVGVASYIALSGLFGFDPHRTRIARFASPLVHYVDRWELRLGQATLSMLGCVEPERDQTPAHARDIADRLIASLPGMLLYWHHFTRNGVRLKLESGADSVAAHFLTLLHRRPPPESWVRAMHTSLVLYAEHELNASTFTTRVIAGTGSDLYSCIAGGIGALRGPKHGGANEVALEIQERYGTPEEAVADIRARLARKEVVIGFGHPVYTVADPRNRVIKDVARRLRQCSKGRRRPRLEVDKRHVVAGIGEGHRDAAAHAPCPQAGDGGPRHHLNPSRSRSCRPSRSR